MAKMQLATVKQELVATRPSFQEMNLNKLDFNKELEFAIQAFQSNDFLLGCDPKTIQNALVNVVMTGLTLNPVMKFCYLVPRNGKCCVDPSYMGLIKIITDTGSVKSIKAGLVYSKELFDIELGSGGYVKHKPFMGEGTKGTLKGAYSIALLNDGSYHVEYMYVDELNAIKARSEMGKKDKGSWVTDYPEMCRKTVVKRHWKYLPKSERALMAAQAIDLDNDLNGIDFNKEQQQQQTQSQPNMEEGVALCTDEDIDRIMELFDDPAMPDIIFISEKRPSGFAKDKTRAKIQELFDAGTYEKSRAEQQINALEDELAKATAPDVDLAGETTDTDAKAEAEPPAVEIETKSAVQPNESFEDFK